MTETAFPGAALVPVDETEHCRHCLPIDGELIGLFGHDALGHRIVTAMMREGLTARWQLARATNLELLLIRHVGALALARIRAVFPEPPPAPLASAPARPPGIELATDEATGEPLDVTDTDRQRLALLARLPAEVDVAPAMLTDSASAAALWVLTALSRTDPRIWRHVHPTGISFPRILTEDGFSTLERVLLRVARSIAGANQYTYVDVDLPGIARCLDDDQWSALLTALQVCRAGLRGDA